MENIGRLALVSGIGLFMTYKLYHSLQSRRSKEKPKKDDNKNEPGRNRDPRHIETFMETEERFYMGIWKAAKLTDDGFVRFKNSLTGNNDPEMEAVDDMVALLTLMRKRDMIRPGSFSNIVGYMEAAGIQFDHAGVNKQIQLLEEAVENWIQANVSDVYDILIIHTEDDVYDASKYKEHLVADCGIEDLKVLLLGEFEIGKGHFRGIEDIFAKTRYIFVYVTPNLTRDELVRMQHETALVDSFTQPSKMWRIVPVQTTERKCDIIELNTIRGLNYWSYCNSNIFKRSYVDAVKSLIRKGREEINPQCRDASRES